MSDKSGTLCTKCGVGHIDKCHKCKCGKRFTPFRKCGECLDKENKCKFCGSDKEKFKHCKVCLVQ